MSLQNEKLTQVLLEGGIAVIPTDTIYGIVARALDEEVVNRIYSAKGRSPEKPCIILISDLTDLEKFSIFLSEKQKDMLRQYWNMKHTADGNIENLKPTSIVLICPNKDLFYLHRGTNSLAFRLPHDQELRDLISKTGPLIAPSANIEGFPPSRNIKEAQEYFGDKVDLYIDGGEIISNASKLIKLEEDGSVAILRA